MTIHTDAAQPRDLKRLLAQDDLAGALTLATEAVKRAPQDQAARLLLIDLLILAQDWERADRQAGLAAALAPKEAVGLGLLRGEIRGMHARARWYEEAAVPSFPEGPTAADEAALRLAVARRAGDAASVAEAMASLSRIEPARLSWNGGPVDDLRDCDDRLPHALEAITSGGAYLWIDFTRIEQVAFAPAARPRDLAFRRAQVRLRGGSAAPVLVPALYYAAGPQSDAVRLGRETGWVEEPGGVVTGYGQRCFLVGDAMAPIAEAGTLAREGAVDG